MLKTCRVLVPSVTLTTTSTTVTDVSLLNMLLIDTVQHVKALLLGENAIHRYRERSDYKTTSEDNVTWN